MSLVHSTFPVDAYSPTAKLDIVVVNFETPGLLQACLRSIEDCSTDGGVGHAGPCRLVGEVIVVDNSQSESGAALAREVSRNVRFLRPASNAGYGSAANAGVAATSAEYVLVLNADTLMTPGAVAALVDDLDRNPGAAIVGPRLIDNAGRIQPSCADFPTVAKLLLHESGMWKILRRTRLSRQVRPYFEEPAAVTVPWVLGAALAVRRAPFEAVGGFEPSFFLYYEEVDLCRRLADAGSTTRFTPEAVIRHVGGASTADEPLSSQRPMYRSLAVYMRRHGRHADLIGLRLAVIVIAAARLVRDTFTAVVRRRADAASTALTTWMSIMRDAGQGWVP